MKAVDETRTVAPPGVKVTCGKCKRTFVTEGTEPVLVDWTRDGFAISHDGMYVEFVLTCPNDNSAIHFELPIGKLSRSDLNRVFGGIIPQELEFYITH